MITKAKFRERTEELSPPEMATQIQAIINGSLALEMDYERRLAEEMGSAPARLQALNRLS